MLEATSPVSLQTALNIVLGSGLTLYVVRHVLERRKRLAEVDLSDAQARRHDTESKLAVYDRAFARIESLEATVEKLEAKVERWKEHAGKAEGDREKAEGERDLLREQMRQMQIEMKKHGIEFPY